MLNFFNFSEVKLLHILFALIIFFGGYWVSKWIARRVGNMVEKMLSKHEGMVCQRLIFYCAILLFLIAALQQLGFNLGVLLGAAGVFTVGVGFAAQTSLANLISGLFLLMERPFKVGDKIVVKGYTGVVDSIDLLSTRLCATDHTMVRIPNQNMMQAEVINLNYFKTRCLTLTIGLEYGVNLDKVRKVLMGIAAKNSLAYNDPKPTVTLSDFGASTINIQFSVWGDAQNYTNLKSSIQEMIKTAFEEEEINMPFPQMTIHTVKLDTEGNSA